MDKIVTIVRVGGTHRGQLSFQPPTLKARGGRYRAVGTGELVKVSSARMPRARTPVIPSLLLDGARLLNDYARQYRLDMNREARTYGMGEFDNGVDAFRHMVTSADLVDKTTPEIAEDAGLFYEMVFANENPNETVSDLLNNTIGREIAGREGNRADYRERAAEYVQEGSHWTKEKVNAERNLPRDVQKHRQKTRDLLGDHRYTEPTGFERGGAFAPDKDHMPKGDGGPGGGDLIGGDDDTTVWV